MLRLIINADDLGISEDVNKAVAECFSKRFITSTTLMVNMEYADEAVELARKNGWHERVGLHLNLTSGMPLTNEIRRYRCFCDRDGRFNAAFAKKTFSRLHLSKNEIAAARTEAEAQIRKYLSYGLADKHLDSHHHVHTNASVWRAIEPLLTAYGIRSVRLTRNLYGKMPFMKRIYKQRYNQRLGAIPVHTTDYFGSFRDFVRYRDGIKDKSQVEIMVHPMYDERGILIDGTNDERVSIEEERNYLSTFKHIKEFY